MVVAIEPRFGVVDRQRADELVVEEERAHECGLQRGRGVEPGCLEVGARPGVHERTAVARHPAGQPFAVADRDLPDHFGVDPGGEAAAQRLAVFVEEEERRAGERHEVGELGGDERHGVRHAQAGTHRLRDFVQRVDLAVREGDILEHVLFGRLLRQARFRAAQDRLGDFGLRLPRRQLEPRGLFLQRRQQLDERRHNRRVESLARLLFEETERGVEAHGLVIGPFCHQRVEEVDDRQDARPEGNLFTLQPARYPLPSHRS